MATDKKLRVVVLSCGDLGFEVAAALRGIAGVECAAVFTAPLRRKPLSLRQRFRHVYRTQGLTGFGRVLWAKLRRHLTPDQAEGRSPQLAPELRHLHFDDLHDAACIAELRELDVDLGVVAGTYILGEAVFSIPRLGSINLHSGKAPQYRGAAPAFWELYNGETEVGITIHRVTAELDGGGILLQETFPLDPAPVEDPLRYLERYRAAVLRPNGIRMLAAAVDGIASGQLQEVEQDPAVTRTYRSPDRRAVRELYRRVRRRRRSLVRA